MLLLLAVACGTAATPTPSPTATPMPRPTVGQVAAPAPTARPAATPTATPVPAPTATPVPVVNPGKVTWMVTSFANERFDYTFTAGGGNDYARIFHAWLISSDVKEGKRVVIPGIATKWEISSDGLTWALTIRKGVKFHDGTEVIAEDVLWTLRHVMGPQAKGYATSGGATAMASIMDRIEQIGPDRVNVTTKVPVADYYYQPKNGFPIDKRVNFTLLDLRLVPEEATRVAALRAGEGDIAPVSLGARKQIEAGGGRLVFGQEGVVYATQQLGCRKPEFPCHDKRVRQAPNYAINKELIRDKLYGGPEVMQVKGWITVTPSTIGYSPELDPFPFDEVSPEWGLGE